MSLLKRYLTEEVEKLRTGGIRLAVIGRRDRLPETVLNEIELAERATAPGSKLHLRLAIDYSSRDQILYAASRVGGAESISRERFARTLAACPDVDLLIRTGGEQRLSDFLLWESAYAELIFTPRMWPDFSVADLHDAIAQFRGRERRFGRVPLSARIEEAIAANHVEAGRVHHIRGDRWLR